MDKPTYLTGVRLTPNDADLLKRLAGPRGGSKLIRSLIRAEAARRAIMESGRF